MKKYIKIFMICGLFFSFLLMLYWGKCQFGINVFSGVSWETYLPFLEPLQRKPKIFCPATGEIFEASFEGWFPLVSWNDLWSRDKDTARVALVRAGRDGSRGLRVESASDRDWAMYHNFILEVEPGEVFNFSGWLRTEEDAKAQLSVILYAADGRVLNWGLGARRVQATEWTVVESEFVVPANGARMRFQLTGSGRGVAFFDDVQLQKLLG